MLFKTMYPIHSGVIIGKTQLLLIVLIICLLLFYITWSMCVVDSSLLCYCTCALVIIINPLFNQVEIH